MANHAWILKLLLCALAFGTGWCSHQRSLSSTGSKVPTAKIVNGQDVVKRLSGHPHPYIVSIQYKDSSGHYQHTCGAAILDRWTLISAAHCFDDSQQPNCWGHDSKCYRIVAGMHDLHEMQDPEKVQISYFPSDAIESHKNFDGFHYDNDIALIFLSNPLNYTSFVRPIRLVDPDRPYRRTNATIVGWGKSLKHSPTLDTAPEVTPVLQEARVKIYPDDHCIHQWGDDYHPDNMICATGDTLFDHATTKVADACSGDSGGPLVAKDLTKKRRYLVGLVSWGFDCGVPQYPGLFTRVKSYLLWIEEKRQERKAERGYV